MKMLVLSDSHGNVENMARAVEQVQPTASPTWATLCATVRSCTLYSQQSPWIRCRAIATWPL